MNFVSKAHARKLHRFIAYTAAAFLLWMSLTGFLLNHSSQLKLADLKIQQPWLLRWHHINLPKIEQSFPVDKHWIVMTNQGLYRDAHKILTTDGSIQAVLQGSGLSFAILTDSVLLLSEQGELIDRIALPNALLKPFSHEIQYQHTENHPLIMLHNEQALALNAAMTHIREIPPSQLKNPTDLEVISEAHLPEKIKTSLRQNANPLTLEKLLVELHNGKFFGNAGPWILDFLALTFIMMIISGIRLHLKK